LEDDLRPDRRRELFGVQTGFNTARLLEGDSKWESAAAIYQNWPHPARREKQKARLVSAFEHFAGQLIRVFA
jgi:hypothetical protein